MCYILEGGDIFTKLIKFFLKFLLKSEDPAGVLGGIFSLIFGILILFISLTILSTVGIFLAIVIGYIAMYMTMFFTFGGNNNFIFVSIIILEIVGLIYLIYKFRFDIRLFFNRFTF
jgi:hypothetical protein